MDPIAPARVRARCAVAGAIALVLAPESAAAAPEYHLSDEPGGNFEALATRTPEFELGAASLAPPDDDAQPAPVADTPQVLVPEPLRLSPDSTRATIITSGVLFGATLSGLYGGFTDGYDPPKFGNEYWFGRHTYTGGADKASHFVLYNGLARELSIAYNRMGYAEDRAFKMAFGTSLAAGLITEILNSTGFTGFSYEDLIMDALGAGTAIFMTRRGLDDVAGFRFGFIPAAKPQPCCPYDELGRDYSNEIYTADLKLAGIARRLHVNPGPARWLLTSFTYGTKGYKYSEPGYREQQVGFEVGINFPEILTALGVKESTWWGRTLFIFFNFIRIPYTQIGFYYDVLHGNWYGPGIGQQYDPGPGVPPAAAARR